MFAILSCPFPSSFSSWLSTPLILPRPYQCPLHPSLHPSLPLRHGQDRISRQSQAVQTQLYNRKNSQPWERNFPSELTHTNTHKHTHASVHAHAVLTHTVEDNVIFRHTVFSFVCWNHSALLQIKCHAIYHFRQQTGFCDFILQKHTNKLSLFFGSAAWKETVAGWQAVIFACWVSNKVFPEKSWF